MKKLWGICKMDFQKSMKNKVFLISVIVGVVAGVALVSNLFDVYGEFTSFIHIMNRTALIGFINMSIIFPAVSLGKDNDDLFYTMNIKSKESILSKILNLIVINSIFFIITFIFFITLILYFNKEIFYGLEQLKVLFLYQVIASFYFSIIGMLCGIFIGKIYKGIFAYIVSFMISLQAIGFNRTIPSFDVIWSSLVGSNILQVLKIDRYFYENLKIWIMILIALVIFFSLVEVFRVKRKKMLKYITLVVCIISICIIKNGDKDVLPTRVNEALGGIFYDDFLSDELAVFEQEFDEQGNVILDEQQNARIKKLSKADVEKVIQEAPYIKPKSDDNMTIIQVIGELPYKVKKYSMDIKLENDLKNTCTMAVERDNVEVSKLRFSFYGKSKIESLKINDIEAKYEQDASTVYMYIPEEVKENEIEIEMKYSAYINTIHCSNSNSDFVQERCGFLSGTFPWYPKIVRIENEEIRNVMKAKAEEEYYDISIDSKCKKVYSNIDLIESNGKLKGIGVEKNIMIYYGDNLVESEIKGKKIVLPKEVLESEKIVKRRFEYVTNQPYFTDDEVEQIYLIPAQALDNYSKYKNTLVVSEDSL